MCFGGSDSDGQSGAEYNAEYNRRQQEEAARRKAMIQPKSAPTPSDVAPQTTSEQRRARLNALKFGAMSTIKTSPLGITGRGPELQTPAATGSKTIG